MAVDFLRPTSQHVWLAVNTKTPRYVAVKVMMARYTDAWRSSAESAMWSKHSLDSSSHILQALDIFQEHGPNGTHVCLVSEPMAGTVATMVEWLSEHEKIRNTKYIYSARYPRPLAKRILKHTLLGLRALQDNDVVHGDLQPGNLLFAARDLENVDERELFQDEADIRPELKRLNGKQDLWSPRYLVLGQSLHKYARLGEDAHIKISDLGEAFFKGRPPNKIVTPIALRAPETILCLPVDEKIDIWSFGCLLYELFAGTRLFPVDTLGDDSQDDADDDHLLEMHEILGKLPENLIKAWPRAADWFGPGGERLNPRANSIDATKGGQARDDDVRRRGQEDRDSDDDDDDDDLFIDKPLEDLFEENRPSDMGTEEARIITTLIRRVLRYEPAERPSAAELLEDSWFQDC